MAQKGRAACGPERAGKGRGSRAVPLSENRPVFIPDAICNGKHGLTYLEQNARTDVVDRRNTLAG